MYDTTEKSQAIEVGDAAPNGLIVTAEVLLRDRSNVSVSKPSLDAALAIIRRRHHTRPPVIELAAVHANDPVCFVPGRWRVTPESLEPLDSGEQDATTYLMEFRNFSVITPGEGSIAAKSSLPTVVAAAQSLANRNVETFELTSSLPGFRTQVLEPESFDDTVEITAVPDIPPKPDTSPHVPTQAERFLSRAKHRISTIAPKRRTKDRSDQNPQASLGKNPHSPKWAKNGPLLLTVGAVALVGLLIAALLLFAPSRDTEPASADAWFTPAPTAQPAETELLDGYDKKLWDIPAKDASALSWFKAGVAHVTPDNGELVLTDTTSGDEIAKTKLDAAVKYTAEFMTGDTAAIAARTDKSVAAINADGKTQTWPVEKDQTLNVTGTTPMLMSENGKVHALIFGENKPVEVTPNPQFVPVSIDDRTLIQIESGKPRLVTIPFGENSPQATTVQLTPPVQDATFVRHVSAGHGLAVAEWKIDNTSYVVVHKLDNGKIAGAAEASDNADEWKIGRGLETAIIGTTAFSLSTGSAVAHSTTGNFTTALGPAAVTDSGSSPTYYVNKHTYTDTDRVIGYTGSGIALVRGSNGAVTANEKGSSK